MARNVWNLMKMAAGNQLSRHGQPVPQPQIKPAETALFNEIGTTPAPKPTEEQPSVSIEMKGVPAVDLGKNIFSGQQPPATPQPPPPGATIPGADLPDDQMKAEWRARYGTEMPPAPVSKQGSERSLWGRIVAKANPPNARSEVSR